MPPAAMPTSAPSTAATTPTPPSPTWTASSTSCDAGRVTTALPLARRIWDVVEPIAANVYFAPEVHRAYQALGFEGSSRTVGRIEYPDGVAYFTSRGACLGPGVSGHVVAAALRVFQRPMVVDAVAEGWRRADQPSVLEARQQGATASLRL